jgi:hypothetical protein
VLSLSLLYTLDASLASSSSSTKFASDEVASVTLTLVERSARAAWRIRTGEDTERRSAVFGVPVPALLLRDLKLRGAGRSGVLGGNSLFGEKVADHGAVPLFSDGSESALIDSFADGVLRIEELPDLLALRGRFATYAGGL